MHVLLEWLTIEDQARFDFALQNHMDRKAHLHLLQHTEHGGVLSVSGTKKGYTFNSAAVEWLESRNIFMSARFFSDARNDVPTGFSARTGRRLLQLTLQGGQGISYRGFAELARSCPRLEDVVLARCELSNEKMATLAAQCPGLRSLDVPLRRFHPMA
jgi:hypothetical protein